MYLSPLPPDTRVDLDALPTTPPDDVPRGHRRREELASRLAGMGEMQATLRAEGTRALLIVLQGRDAAGKDGTIRKVFEGLDPQGCQVTPFKRPTETELQHDFLWRVHLAVPPYGRIGIFNRSHYESVLVERVHQLVPRKRWKARYAQINDFERMLVENGVAVLKLFLHISKPEQRRRLLARLDDPRKNWKWDPEDLDERDRWEEYTDAYADALARCSTEAAPWWVVPADDKKARNLMVADLVAHTLERMAPQYPRADPAVLKEGVAALG